MKLSWKKITSLPKNVLEKDTEEVSVAYEEKSHHKQREKKHALDKRKIKKPFEREQGSEWLPGTGQGQLVVDIYEDAEKSALVVESTIAGVKPEDIDITVEPDLIVIRGQREKEKASESHHYYYQECFWGRFSRTMVLPVRVLPDKVKAGLKNGILTVILPKAEEGKDRENIKVKE